MHDPEVALATVLGEMRTVKDECSRLRNIVEQVGAYQVDALKTEWSHMVVEATTRQSGMATRLARLEGQLNHLVSDQHSALESNQQTWRTIQDQWGPNLPEFAPPAASASSAGMSSTRGVPVCVGLFLFGGTNLYMFVLVFWGLACKWVRIWTGLDLSNRSSNHESLS